MNYFKNYLLVILLFFISSTAWSLETVHFCLNERGHLNQAKAYLSDILLADEFVDVRRSVNCLEVGVRSYRKDLLSNYLRRRFKFRVATSQGGQISLEHSSTNLMRSRDNRMCRIRFEQVMHNSNNNANYEIGKRTHIKDNSRNRASKMESQLLLTSGIAGMIKVNGQPLVVTCFVISATEYRLQFSLGDKILSSVSLRKGARINVGSIVSGGTDSGKGIQGASLYKNKTSSNGLTEYFMSIL